MVTSAIYAAKTRLIRQLRGNAGRCMVGSGLCIRSPLLTLEIARRERSNEKEISHGRVSWQTRCAWSVLGPLASSIGRFTVRIRHLDSCRLAITCEVLIRPQSTPADERHGESSMTAQQVNWLQIFLRRIRFAVERA
jgi:hypothetical protein